MRVFGKGRYRARRAETQHDIEATQRLRHLAFRNCEGIDTDRFDEICHHIMVEEVKSGLLVACYRFMPLAGGDEIGQSYSAQFYDLLALQSFPGPMVEIGRFCLQPGLHDPDILRVAWGALTRFVDQEGVELLFGCSSFPGTRPEAHSDAFAWIRDRHLAPERWQPRVKAPEVFRFSTQPRRKPDARRALLAMPPLLRTYLGMGGWVSDHAVIDTGMNTLHVFTALEVKSVPAARARALRAVAG